MTQPKNNPSRSATRTAIIAQYPWLAPNEEAHGIVMGDDLDAALSTALYLQHHPNAQVIGLYKAYTTVYFSSEVTWDEALDAIWLDLDIYHPRCKSLGHHIIRLRPEDSLPGFIHSCNINELFHTSMANFKEKYPLGSVHFLMWLYQEEIPSLENANLLIWLADSAYINGQSAIWRWDRASGKRARAVGFRWNVRRWLQNRVPVKSLQRTFRQIDTRQFEERMIAFHRAMQSEGFQAGSGQVYSHHLQLSGYQCQPTPNEPLRSYLPKILNFVGDRTGWSVRPDQLASFRRLGYRSGRRQKQPISVVSGEGLDGFLSRNRVFSFVFPHSRVINFTSGLDHQ